MHKVSFECLADTRSLFVPLYWLAPRKSPRSYAHVCWHPEVDDKLQHEDAEAKEHVGRKHMGRELGALDFII